MLGDKPPRQLTRRNCVGGWLRGAFDYAREQANRLMSLCSHVDVAAQLLHLKNVKEAERAGEGAAEIYPSRAPASFTNFETLLIPRDDREGV